MRQPASRRSRTAAGRLACMGSTLRNDTSIAVFASRLVKCMEKRKDLTFGQLLYEALQQGDQPVDAALNLRRFTDTQLVEAVERFVLKG